MNKQKIIDQTAGFAKKILAKQESAHDWWHVYRVWKMAKYLAKKEGADQFMVQLTSLLHDIDDYKLQHGNEAKAQNNVRRWLQKIGTAQVTADEVCSIIHDMSFKGAGTRSRMATLEGKIVQDADYLDALGAIGIARVFAFGPIVRRKIYDPDIKVRPHKSYREWKQQYRKIKPVKTTSINHFYEKLLLLKNRLNTKTAKKIAAKRHQFMLAYLAELKKEIKV